MLFRQPKALQAIFPVWECFSDEFAQFVNVFQMILPDSYITLVLAQIGDNNVTISHKSQFMSNMCPGFATNCVIWG